MRTGPCVAVIQVDLTVVTCVTMGTQTLVVCLGAHTGAVVVTGVMSAHVLHFDLTQLPTPTCTTKVTMCNFVLLFLSSFIQEQSYFEKRNLITC